MAGQVADVEYPFWFDDEVDFGRTREALELARYHERGIAELLGGGSLSSFSGADLPLLLHRTSDRSPLASLIRLFLLDVSVERDDAARACAPAKLEAWERAGLVVPDGDEVRRGAEIRPLRGHWLLFDIAPRTSRGRGVDYVMGAGASSLTLADLTIRRPCENALDLGTGCGIQAFFAASHAKHVIAADMNPRAVAITRFNARLNGIKNVEGRVGDLFEPVQGTKFDMIVSNPPFVISPSTNFIFRDSGLMGDEICRSIVREAPAVLAEGGVCQILCNWAHVSGHDWQERIAEWFAGSGCDAWVMRFETLDAPAYASTWIRHTESDDRAAQRKLFAEWLDYYKQHGIEAVSGGAILLRRRMAAKNWLRIDDIPTRIAPGTGRLLEAMLRSIDRFHGASESDLLGSTFEVEPDLNINQLLRSNPDGWSVDRTEAARSHGLFPPTSIDQAGLRLLSQIRRDRTIHEAIVKLADLLEMDAAEITSPCLEAVRAFIDRGFLTPVAEQGPPGEDLTGQAN